MQNGATLNAIVAWLDDLLRTQPAFTDPDGWSQQEFENPDAHAAPFVARADDVVTNVDLDDVVVHVDS
jgi:hypothetical protein